MFKVGQTVWTVESNGYGKWDVEKGKVATIEKGKVYIARTVDFEGEKERMVVERKPDRIFDSRDGALLEALAKTQATITESIAHAISLAIQVKS